MTDSVKIPLFKKADLDASIGVFFDGFSKVIVAVAILLGTFGLDGATVFGTMMPGVLVNVIVLNGGLWLYYRHVAKSRGDRDLTAIPAGLQAGRMFIWLYSIMLPVYNTTAPPSWPLRWACWPTSSAARCSSSARLWCRWF